MNIDSEKLASTADIEESKTGSEDSRPSRAEGVKVWRDSDSDSGSEQDEKEERRNRDIAKLLNKQRRSKSNAKMKAKNNKRARQ